MPASNRMMIRKLQDAINMHGGQILIDKAQFFSQEQNRAITIFKVCTPKNDGTKRKNVLFDTPSQIQVVLFLRDYWYAMNGMEIPTDNEQWNEVKRAKGISFETTEERKEDSADG